jgi:transcriptional regulator with XRE-family HTH domain
MVRKRRGELGLRETALEVGVSPATLSRVERGQLPDIDTFSKLCEWLKVDPAEFLGVSRPVRGGKAGVSPESEHPVPSVHFRAKSATSPQAARDLAQLILAAQEEMARRGML